MAVKNTAGYHPLLTLFLQNKLSVNVNPRLYLPMGPFFVMPASLTSSPSWVICRFIWQVLSAIVYFCTDKEKKKTTPFTGSLEHTAIIIPT